MAVDQKKLELSLLLLRLGVFIVMFMWTIEKFFNPSHQIAIMEYFYFMPGIGERVVHALGAAELVVVLMFVAGVKKTFSYGTVLVLHGLSTFLSFREYLDPFNNMLFFAAWPMLAACLTLVLLREQDQKYSLG